MTDLSGYTVRRLHIHKDIHKDRFDIVYPDETAVNVGYSTAHDFMLGKVDPDQLRHTDQEGNGVFLL